jgi:hypothetical protein
VRAQIRMTFDDAYFMYDLAPELTLQENQLRLHNHMKEWLVDNLDTLVRNVQINYVQGDVDEASI